MAEAKPTTTHTPSAAPAAPAAQTPPVREDANRQAARAEKARVDARTEAERKLEEDDQARHEFNVEAGRRQAESKPTPTQRENDLAKLGHPVDEKEDDGSGPEVQPGGLRRDASADDAAKYKTRDMNKK